jgi:hypothetical protein
VVSRGLAGGERNSSDAERLAKRAEKRLKTPEKSEVGWIHYHAKPKFLRGFRLGDWVVQCIKDGETRNVGPPAQLLSLEEGKMPS